MLYFLSWLGHPEVTKGMHRIPISMVEHCSKSKKVRTAYPTTVNDKNQSQQTSPLFSIS